MGMRHPTFLLSHKRVYGCGTCHSHLSTEECIVSRQFNGQHGKAYLFDQVVNVYFGDAEDRHMTTGMHTVRDIRCRKCAAVLGWKYDRAFVQTEKYKEGKFILEKNIMVDVQ
ncbi:yippee-like protein [Jaminaea rosea]|uniref:Protein yippee-like n=1 Tax=Jaminaea rosea TaxID=1569628 RepID=A0A316UZC7_9BASI|nr:yippee-like protein [Jaminaea rosea]PWN29661.1 yippee-like protein [Jaminaea rosea]